MDAPVDGAALDQAQAVKAYAFDVAAIEGRSNAELMKDMPEAEEMFALLGRDLVTRTLVQTPQLCVYHETAQPGERVKAHRHGVYQVDYVLRGELRFGSRRVTAGMGFFIPSTAAPTTSRPVGSPSSWAPTTPPRHGCAPSSRRTATRSTTSGVSATASGPSC